MTEALLVSNVVLWCLVIVLALMVFALARQVGVLHERVAPAGALLPTSGPRVGEPTEAAIFTDLEEHMTFICRNSEGMAVWGYPVTVEKTPHHLTFSTGERIYAA